MLCMLIRCRPIIAYIYQCHSTESPCFVPVLARPAVGDFSVGDLPAQVRWATHDAFEGDCGISTGALFDFGEDFAEC